MTAEEREVWERQQVLKAPAAKDADKKEWSFMQKYWHKGAFFQEAPDDERATAGPDSIYKRDFSAPTGEDKFNKEMLPAVMQVRA